MPNPYDGFKIFFLKPFCFYFNYAIKRTVYARKEKKLELYILQNYKSNFKYYRLYKIIIAFDYIEQNENGIIPEDVGSTNSNFITCTHIF